MLATMDIVLTATGRTGGPDNVWSNRSQPAGLAALHPSSPAFSDRQRIPARIALPSEISRVAARKVPGRL